MVDCCIVQTAIVMQSFNFITIFAFRESNLDLFSRMIDRWGGLLTSDMCLTHYITTVCWVLRDSLFIHLIAARFNPEFWRCSILESGLAKQVSTLQLFVSKPSTFINNCSHYLSSIKIYEYFFIPPLIDTRLFIFNLSPMSMYLLYFVWCLWYIRISFSYQF